MIQLDSATKEFPGRNGDRVVALRDVCLQIHAGDFAMVVGPSGSGKSTLLFTIGGMQAPTRGRVTLGGTDLYRLSRTARAAVRLTRMGFIFQTFNLIPYLSCLENVALPAILAGGSRSASKQQAGELLERLGLRHRAGHRPAELSVGERQRAALCRSLINEPEVILADEPTGNLDRGLTDEVMRILDELNARGQTIVMVTHDPDLARRGTRIIALHDGSVTDGALSSDGASAR